MIQTRVVLPALVLACAVSRLVAADFTVTNTNNSGPGSLYQAMTDANTAPGPDRVLFNIPGSGIHTIDVSQNQLPAISDSLVIDGYSQPGAKPNTLTVGDNAVILIQIDGGAGTVTANGFVLNGAASDYLLRGLSVTGFAANGVAISASGVHSAVVVGNFIGVLPDGETARGNTTGVGHVTQLGGTDPASRNIISGNSVGFAGVAPYLTGTTVYGAVVQGNYIGTNASGTKAIANQVGVDPAHESPCISNLNPDVSSTIIGGTAAGAGNVISGNATGIIIGQSGMCDRDSTYVLHPHGLRIQGNLIGVQPDRVSPLPNSLGIYLLAGYDNVIGGLEAGAGNVIAFSDAGITVRITGDVRNQILSNAIYANGIGIDLGGEGPTPNDAGDPDDGPNNLQNYPVIQSAQVANGSVTIKGILNSSANAQFTLQYFSESLDLVNPVQKCIGTNTVTTDANGNAQFSGTFPLTDTNVAFNMTATSQDGNTSEFTHNPARLRNVSTRARVLNGDHVTIAGFIRRSNLYSAMVVRALGPSIPGVDSLRDPTLEVYDIGRSYRMATNDDWRKGDDAAYLEFVGLAPPHDSESALRVLLTTGNYTAVVRGADGGTGIGLIEAYAMENELLNISTRGFVGTGDDVMIAGTILEPLTSSTRIVARAVGPSLASAGVIDPLADPMLELRDSQGALIAANDDWRDGNAAGITALGLAPKNDKESAIFARLSPGAYTATIRGKDGGTGVGLVELYNLH